MAFFMAVTVFGSKWAYIVFYFKFKSSALSNDISISSETQIFLKKIPWYFDFPKTENVPLYYDSSKPKMFYLCSLDRSVSL